VPENLKIKLAAEYDIEFDGMARIEAVFLVVDMGLAQRPETVR
jgi:hypothetical protein